jgi:hypothetical protein
MLGEGCGGAVGRREVQRMVSASLPVILAVVLFRGTGRPSCTPSFMTASQLPSSEEDVATHNIAGQSLG